MKPWYKSKTLAGIFISVLPKLAMLAGYDISADELSALFANITQGIGIILAIYGRIVAKTDLTA